MPHDISHSGATMWAARTATGMIFVAIDERDAIALAGADLVTVRDDAGDRLVARMIGPLAGEAPVGEWWRVEGRYRVESEGERLASVATASLPDAPNPEGHEWGALGLPGGLDTRVRTLEQPPGMDELAIARASRGHRLGEETLLLRLAPGDQVRAGSLVGTVLAVDRRKRTVEVFADDQVRSFAFDDVQTQETT